MKKGEINGMKSKQELMELRDEYETMEAKLRELSEEEYQQVIGGMVIITSNYTYCECKHPHCGKTGKVRNNRVGEYMECPRCFNMTYLGVNYVE